MELLPVFLYLPILDNLYDSIDLILVMTVHPGLAGQKFLPSQLKKLLIFAVKSTPQTAIYCCP
ncbi:MAG: hypothetical protein IRF6MM_06020 [Candidatus Midichloria mitochondrii]